MMANARRALRWALRRLKRSVSPVELPDKPWLEKAADYAAYTPDVPRLEQKGKVLVFLYDSHQKEHDNNFVIADEAGFVGTAFTTGHYNLIKKMDGDETLPIALKEQDRPRLGRLRGPLLTMQPHSIKGELWLAPWQLLITLDTIHENGYVHRRERVKVVLPFDIQHGSYRTSERQYVHLWAYWYVGSADWYQAISNDPDQFKEVGKYDPHDPMLRRYYSFTKQEYDD